MSRKQIIIALVLVVIAAMIWAIDIKWKTVELNNGFDDAARQNPYLAAQLFIEQTASDDKTRTAVHNEIAESQFGFTLIDQLPSTDDTIIITSGRFSLGQRRTELLNQWVKQGGSLIVVAQMPYDFDNERSGDLLLDPLQIKLVEPELSEVEENGDHREFEAAEDEPLLQQTVEQLIAQSNQQELIECEFEPLLSAIGVSDSEASIEVNIGGSHVLLYPEEQEPSGWASNADGVKIVQVELGEGDLTVLTDLGLWNNRQLSCFDNAYLLEMLTGTESKSWILYHEDMPGIMTLLWRNNAALVLSALLLLVLWLWSKTLRFGTVYTVTTRVRRDFMAHLEASARYQWRSGAELPAVELLRHQIQQKVALRHDDYDQLSQQQQCELIGRLSDMSAAQVHQALFAAIPEKPQALIGTVAILQQLRKQLW